MSSEGELEADIERTLREIVEAPSETYAIFAKRGPHNRFVQAMNLELGLTAESVGEEFLSPGDSFSADDLLILDELGWGRGLYTPNTGNFMWEWDYSDGADGALVPLDDASKTESDATIRRLWYTRQADPANPLSLVTRSMTLSDVARVLSQTLVRVHHVTSLANIDVQVGER